MSEAPSNILKKTIFYVLMGVLVVVVVELAAVAGHSVLDGRIFSPHASRERARTVVASSRTASWEDTSLLTTSEQFEARWLDVIHPYFGVVVDPDLDPTGTVSDLGFVSGPSAQAITRRLPDTMVVGIFGGSFAADVYRQSARGGGPRIEQLLGTDIDCPPAEQPCGRKAVAVNFAKKGYKQPQQLMVLAYLLALGAQIDVVVNIDGFNEVALPPVENLDQGVHPFYPRKWHLKTQSVLAPEAIRKVGYLEHLKSVRRHRAGQLIEHGFYRSAVLSLLWRAIDRRLSTSIQDARSQVDSADEGRASFRLIKRSWTCLKTAGVPKQVVSWLRPLKVRPFGRREDLHQAVVRQIGIGRATAYRQAIEQCAARVTGSYATRGPKYIVENREELFDDLVEMWQRSSFQMRALCDAYGIRYYHFLQPNQYLEGSKPMTREERRIAINPAQAYRQGVVDGYPRLRAAGRELLDRGVAFTDLTMLFAHATEVFYADDCCHLNPNGYAVVLDEILETIAANQG